MALMDFIKKQFIDILQWTEDADGTLAWRFPMAEMEIQNGAIRKWQCSSTKARWPMCSRPACTS
jgi:membrane protease subunit (stomatin/prohibitin family)